MSAHALLILLKELEKKDKMRGLLNKINKTWALMLDSIYHMTLKLFLKYFFLVENFRVLPYDWR